MRLNLVEGAPVLVTGAGGFIGSHLVEHLLELGADVTALVRYDSRSSNGWLEEVCRSERFEDSARRYSRSVVCGKPGGQKTLYF